MRISIDNRQRLFRMNQVALRQVAADLAALAAASRGVSPWREAIVILLDDAGMTDWNLRVMRYTGSTDVISQRYEPLPGEPAGMRGELLVNVERAWQVGAQRRNWPPSRELALYIAHGFDHLNDAEDASSAGRQRMRRRELRWLCRIHIPALFSKLARQRRQTPQ